MHVEVDMSYDMYIEQTCLIVRGVADGERVAGPPKF